MAPLRVAITGANGFIGSALCASMRDAGWLVREITRQQKSRYLPHDSVDFVANGLGRADFVDAVGVGDIDGSTDWAHTLRDCDVVVHLAAHQTATRQSSAQADLAFERVNALGTLNLAKQAAASGVKRFVLLSTVKIHGEATPPSSTWIEASPPNPQSLYSQSKYRAEMALIAAAAVSAMEWVVVRPPMVYGPGHQASNIRSLVRWVELGVPLPLGLVRNQRSIIALPNLIDFILLCAVHPNAANQTFLVSDGCDISVRELVQKIAAFSCRPVKLVPVPISLLKICSAFVGQAGLVQRLTGNLQVDISKAKELLEWRPPYTVEDGLQYFLRGEIDKKVV